MLFSTSLVALILSPRRLQITNTKVCLCLLLVTAERDLGLSEEKLGFDFLLGS